MNRDQRHAAQRLGDADLQVLKRDGVVIRPGFLSAEEILRVREITLRLRPTAEGHKNPARKLLLMTPFHGLRQSARASIRNDLVWLSRVAQEGGFRDFARRFYAQDACLDHIVSIESPRSADPITAWHADGSSAAESFTLKFFLYLKDIDASAGAFSYLRGTNRPVTALRQGIVRGTIAPFSTGNVPELVKALQTKEVVDYLRQQMSQLEADEFARTVQMIDGDPAADLEVNSLSGVAGTLVVFDDRGLHRGGVPRLRERSTLRYNYVTTAYWRARSAHTPLWYARQRLSKAFLPKSIAAHW